MAQFLALFGAQALAVAVVDVGLSHPVPERLVGDAEVGGDLGMVFSLERNRRTASALNSGGYGGFVFGT